MAELLDLVGLGQRGEHLPSELSGGEQQRVSIARALLRDAPIVLADEPTGHLDSRAGAAVLDLLGGIADEGNSVLMVTHDPSVAARGDRVVFLRTREIGLLRALGGTRWLVRRAMADEGLLISVAGTVAGIVLGVAIALFWIHGLKGVLPTMAVHVPVVALAVVAVLGALVGVLASVVPARRAARLDVLEALTYE